jgi:hypothetical protein
MNMIFPFLGIRRNLPEFPAVFHFAERFSIYDSLCVSRVDSISVIYVWYRKTMTIIPNEHPVNVRLHKG